MKFDLNFCSWVKYLLTLCFLELKYSNGAGLLFTIKTIVSIVDMTGYKIRLCAEKEVNMYLF